MFIPVNEREKQEARLTGLLMKVLTGSGHVRENVNTRTFFFFSAERCVFYLKLKMNFFKTRSMSTDDVIGLI